MSFGFYAFLIFLAAVLVVGYLYIKGANSGKKSFDGIYSQIDQVGDKAVLYDSMGAPSVIFRIENPVQQLCTDSEKYCEYFDVLQNIVQTLGEGYSFQKQDIFCKQKFHHEVPENAEFLTKSYFKFFEGRPYTEIQTYLIITQEPQKNIFIQFDSKKWEDFLIKVDKIENILSDKNIRHRKLSVNETKEYVKRFVVSNFRKGAFSVNNLVASDKGIKIDNNITRSFPLVDIDEFNIPSEVSPYTSFTVNGQRISTDMLSFLPGMPDSDCVIYNQLIQIPAQRKLQAKLHTKSNRHGSMGGAANSKAQEDIELVLQQLSTESKLLVKCNFNILISCPEDKISKETSHIENKLFDLGITPSKTATNQWELFIASFPGNGYKMNNDYDLFLMLSEAALCFCYKEHLKTDEITPLKTYYTDRQGLPVCIDFTGKEGSVKYTDNSNFFCIGPSGSGKSFHMNTVVRQLLMQDTDVVMVDTGNSYEGISSYYNGTYISHTPEHPITMNPFKVTRLEYEENFEEKMNFLKSLIFLIFKGNNVSASQIEDTIIDEVITGYYDAYFNPFTEFSDEERIALRSQLKLLSKKSANYDREIELMDELQKEISKPPVHINQTPALLLPSEEKREKILNTCRKLNAVIRDDASSEAEKEKATFMLDEYVRQLQESSKAVELDKKITLLEKQKRNLRVNELSFNSFYEYAIERIPQIMSRDETSFDITNFAAITKKFYRGGKYQDMLNSDMEVNLFDEKFIVFEIDTIKDNAVLFPIVVLIIMDVFIQKMRLKKGRKALIIEEAWKAIDSPTMAEYIKYLYKTVRKFHGIAGVITQELNDVIDSPIVKEAIINNSDIKILLEQTKFKDRYDEISSILGLTDIQKQQIFTINSLNNKEGRDFFKEVWICRGQNSDVYGVEEPPECYWAFTTERPEKEALKIYMKHFGNIEQAIVQIEKDRKKASVAKYLDFAKMVNKRQKPMYLWND